MPVATLITELDTAAANNSPPGTESARGNIDDYLRSHAAFIRQLHNAVQSGSYAWAGTAGGTANDLTLTLTPAITAYSAGQRFLFKSGAAANTAATTASVSGLTPLAVQVNGAACAGGEIAANMWYEILIDASLTSCQLNKIGKATLAELGAAASGANSDITSLTGLTDLPSFSAKNISSLSSSVSNQTILNGSEDFDAHGCYNPATGTFIADRAGKYVFNAAAGIESVTTAGVAGIEFTKNGANGQRRAQKTVQIGEFDNLNLSEIFDLALGDTVNVQLNATSAVFAIANTNFQTYFNGHRIR